MADQFNDSIPAVTNQITEDIADIAETLGYLKDCFQKLLGSTWSNTDTSGFALNTFVDLGDSTAWDKTQASMTMNNTWVDYDLSALVPAGTKAVMLLVSISDETLGNQIQFRKNGNTNVYNVAIAPVIVATYTHYYNLIVFCDTNRVIEYNATSTLTSCNICVRGYFI